MRHPKRQGIAVALLVAGALVGCVPGLPSPDAAPSTPPTSAARPPASLVGTPPTATATQGPQATRSLRPVGQIDAAALVIATPLPPEHTQIPAPPTRTLQPAAAAAATTYAATAAAGATTFAGTATALPAQNIRIENFAFAPTTLTVPAGTQIVWRNFDASKHQIAGGEFDSNQVNRGEYWSTVVRKPGKYTYFCSFHPTMTGEIIVTDAGILPPRFST